MYLACESVLSVKQVVAVEGGVEFASLRVLTPEDIMAFCRYYWDAKEAGHKFAVQLCSSKGLKEVAEYRAASDEVAMGRERLTQIRFGPAGSRRLLERLEACQLPSLGDLTFGGAGDGSRSMLREYYQY